MKHFSHSNRDFGTSPHLFGLLLMLAGLFAILSPYLFGKFVSIERIWTVGGIAFLIGLAITQAYSGTLIDTEKGQVKEYFSFFGFKTGEWEKLPKVLKVEPKKISKTSTNTPNGVSPTLSGRTNYYVITLNKESPDPIKLEYKSKKKAISATKELGSRFDAKIASGLI